MPKLSPKSFKKEERLLKSAEFGVTYKKGRKNFSKNFFATAVAGEKRRIGITVSSKVGNAVTRGRIKRVIREYFRLNKEKFLCGDVIVTARASAGQLENSEIRKELEKLVSVYREKNNTVNN